LSVLLDVSASLDEDVSLAIFIVNRSLTDASALSVNLADAKAVEILGVDVLSGTDPRAANTWKEPNVIVPRPASAQLSDNGGISVTVPALGFVVLRAKITPR